MKKLKLKFLIKVIFYGLFQLLPQDFPRFSNRSGRWQIVRMLIMIQAYFHLSKLNIFWKNRVVSEVLPWKYVRALWLIFLDKFFLKILSSLMYHHTLRYVRIIPKILKLFKCRILFGNQDLFWQLNLWSFLIKALLLTLYHKFWDLKL